jgi:hypothetical protein
MDRRVIRGVIGCPVCKAEYPIENGIVEFGVDPLLGQDSRSDDITTEEMPDAETVQALLALSSPGGYVVLVGSVTRLSSRLAESIRPLHHVGVNPPPEVSESRDMSLLRSTGNIPLRSSFARGVVLGREYAREPWLSEAGRVLADGMRLLIADERASVSGVECLAAEGGLWVGQKESTSPT